MALGNPFEKISGFWLVFFITLANAGMSFLAGEEVADADRSHSIDVMVWI
jgi:hypothetical protein